MWKAAIRTIVNAAYSEERYLPAVMTKSRRVRETAKARSERLNRIANLQQDALVERNLASTTSEAPIAATHTKSAEHYEDLAREAAMGGDVPKPGKE